MCGEKSALFELECGLFIFASTTKNAQQPPLVWHWHLFLLSHFHNLLLFVSHLILIETQFVIHERKREFSSSESQALEPIKLFLKANCS